MKTKTVKIEIPDTEPRNGMHFNWTDGWEFQSTFDHDEVVFAANKEGLLSLANHLINLAQDQFPSGHHFHFDRGVELSDDSVAVVFMKI